MIGKMRGLFTWGPDGEFDYLDPNHSEPTGEEMHQLVIDAFRRASENGMGTE